MGAERAKDFVAQEAELPLADVLTAEVLRATAGAGGDDPVEFRMRCPAGFCRRRVFLGA